jgi:hypothetical protein
MMTRDDPGVPRLRFDKVALRLVHGVRCSLEKTVPCGLCVVFTVTAPIREPSKTLTALVEIIRAQLSLGTLVGEHAQTLHGNEVQIRIVTCRSPHAASVAGFVHNPDPPPSVLLNLAESLLKCGHAPDLAGSYDTALDLDMLRSVCEQVFDTDGYAKIVTIIDQRRARLAHK